MMKCRRYALPALTLFALLLSSGTPLFAHDYQAGDLHIDHPYSMATPPGAPNGVAYLAVHHRGADADRLLSASTPVAKRVQLHQSVEADGMFNMKHIELPLTIEAGGELVLQPGGYHFMLMGLTKPLKADTRVPLTLNFESAGAVEVELMVKGLDDIHHGQRDHKGGHHGSH